MACEVEYTDEFCAWWTTLTTAEQDDIAVVVTLLEDHDVRLGFPHSSGMKGSRHSHLRDLQVQSGGDKTGDDRFYERFVPLADDLYDQHLAELRKEGLL